MRGHASERAQLIGAESQDVVDTRIGGREREHAVEIGLGTEHAGGELVGEAPVPFGEPGEMPVARRRKGGAGAHCLKHLQRRAPGGGGVLNPASLRGARRGPPPRAAACAPQGTQFGPPRPPGASHAPSLGSCAAARAVFIRMPSTPCSIVRQASDAVPTPASTTTGSCSRRLMVRTLYGLRSPSPLPIGDASGITAAQPASSSRSAVTRSSLV